MTNNVFIIFSLFFVDCGFSDDVLGDLGKFISNYYFLIGDFLTTMDLHGWGVEGYLPP